MNNPLDHTYVARIVLLVPLGRCADAAEARDSVDELRDALEVWARDYVYANIQTHPKHVDIEAATAICMDDGGEHDDDRHTTPEMRNRERDA